MKKQSRLKRRTRSVVGKLINFRGLVYSPVNEQGVVFLFGKIAHDLGMYVELIRPGYPDCVAKRYIGRERWENVNIEFEYKSSNFDHDEAKCDMIVCWEHDWKECPSHIEVLELREIIKGLPNSVIEAPDKPTSKSEYSLQHHYSKGTPLTKQLYDRLIKQLQEGDDQIYSKPAKYRVYFYSPKRVFAAIKIMKKQLNIQLFTNGKRQKGVEEFPGEYGFKWGRMYIGSKDELKLAVKNLKKAKALVNECISRNEPTGWYAETE